MKNIAILTSTLETGGAEKQCVILANSFAKEHNVFLIVLNGERIDPHLYRKLNPSLRLSIYLFEGSLGTKVLNLYELLKRKNITHLFTYLTLPNVLGSLVGRLAKLEKIYCGIRSAYLPPWKIFLEKHFSHNLCTAIIYNSHASKETFLKKGFKKSVYIGNCFPSISKQKFRQEKEVIRIITVGRFVEAKDYATAIESIKKVIKTTTKIEYIIIGYGELEEQIRTTIAQQKLQKFIKVLINPDNIPHYLSNADIYLSTSLYEGTSNSILEALDASLPIVATEVGDNNQLVINNGFLCPTSNPQVIADKLLYLIKNPKERLEMAKRSKEILRNGFSQENFEQKYFRLL